MSPEVEAAIIAGAVGVLTVIVALYGTRKTSQDTKDGLNKQLTEQREALDRTLKEQGEALDKTLEEQRTRTLNERFATAADQLGSDKPAVRLAGVYAMAGLADDWEKKENRQTCVDVLCAYLRMPYELDPGPDASEAQRLAFQANREVRHTIIRVITAHLKEDAATPWQDLNFDFTSVVFDGGDFTRAQFSGWVNFSGAKFVGGSVDFNNVELVRGRVDFRGARFCGGTVDFHGARFYSGDIDFSRARFSGGTVSFDGAQFSGGWVTFIGAVFSGGTVGFGGAEFDGGRVDFGAAQFFGGSVNFESAWFSGGEVTFSGAEFVGGTVDFDNARFFGGGVDFSDAEDWSFPPAFPWTDTPPSGVKLPRKEDQSQA